MRLDFFLIHPCQCCSASFWISFGGNCSLGSGGMSVTVTMEGAEFRSLLFHHLEWNGLHWTWEIFVNPRLISCFVAVAFSFDHCIALRVFLNFYSHSFSGKESLDLLHQPGNVDFHQGSAPVLWASHLGKLIHTRGFNKHLCTHDFHTYLWPIQSHTSHHLVTSSLRWLKDWSNWTCPQMILWSYHPLPCPIICPTLKGIHQGNCIQLSLRSSERIHSWGLWYEWCLLEMNIWQPCFPEFLLSGKSTLNCTNQYLWVKNENPPQKNQKT